MNITKFIIELTIKKHILFIPFRCTVLSANVYNAFFFKISHIIKKSLDYKKLIHKCYAKSKSCINNEHCNDNETNSLIQPIKISFEP